MREWNTTTGPAVSSTTWGKEYLRSTAKKYSFFKNALNMTHYKELTGPYKLLKMLNYLVLSKNDTFYPRNNFADIDSTSIQKKKNWKSEVIFIQSMSKTKEQLNQHQHTVTQIDSTQHNIAEARIQTAAPHNTSRQGWVWRSCIRNICKLQTSGELQVRSRQYIYSLVRRS